MNSKKTILSPLAIAVTALAGSMAFAGNANAEANPFGLTDLSSGYQVAEGKCGAGKCGAGKCGGDKGKAEGKCGEGKCGGDKAKKEGKCGEGKCGAK